MKKTDDRLRVKVLEVGMSVRSRATPHTSPTISRSCGPDDRDDRKRWCSCSKMPRVRCVVPCLSPPTVRPFTHSWGFV